MILESAHPYPASRVTRFGEVVKAEDLPEAKVDQISGKPSAEGKKSGLENNKEGVSVHAGAPTLFKIRVPA